MQRLEGATKKGTRAVVYIYRVNWGVKRAVEVSNGVKSWRPEDRIKQRKSTIEVVDGGAKETRQA